MGINQCSDSGLTMETDQTEVPAMEFVSENRPSGNCLSASVGDTGCPSNRAFAMPMKRGPWGEEEDLVLLKHVANKGEKDWNTIRERYGLRRTGKSCRLRYRNHLRPNLKKEAFSREEECLMMQLQCKHGNKWALIVQQMPGRTDNEVKNAWHTKRRQEEREVRRAQTNEAEVRSYVRLARTTSCERSVIDGASRATCLRGNAKIVQTKGIKVDVKRGPLGILDRKILHDRICTEQLQPELPTDRLGAGDVVMGVPLILPDQAERGFSATWSPFIWCTGHPVGEPCPAHPSPSGTFIGYTRGISTPSRPAPPVTTTTSPGEKLSSAEAFPTEQSPGAPWFSRTVPGAFPAVDNSRLAHRRHVAGLERDASSGTESSGGPVSGETVTLASAAVQANMENSTGCGAQPAKSTSSIDPPVAGDMAPTRKRHAPRKLQISPDVTMEDAIWADHLFLSPIGPFSRLLPVGNSLPSGFLERVPSPRVPSPGIWNDSWSKGVEGLLIEESVPLTRL